MASQQPDAVRNSYVYVHRYGHAELKMKNRRRQGYHVNCDGQLTIRLNAGSSQPKGCQYQKTNDHSFASPTGEDVILTQSPSSE
eukprot:5716095-Amphidinium_carterae.2